MSSTIRCTTDENVENLPPSTLQCTTDASTKETNSSKTKRTDRLKQRNRRKRWWYFNRGLQPISEVAEIKDDPLADCPSTITNEDDITSRNDSLNIKNDSLDVISSLSPENIIISNENTSLPQGKEGYSPCLKVIEKFQEIVLDSAVRVIQAAFKRFRERRRFLKIKKAVLVIQRNLRKWLQAKHPCLRPAEFDRQSSDGSKSDEYVESEERSVEEDGDYTNESNDIVQCSQVEQQNLYSVEIYFEGTEENCVEDTSQGSCSEHEPNSELLHNLVPCVQTHVSQSDNEIIKAVERDSKTSVPNSCSLNMDCEVTGVIFYSEPNENKIQENTNYNEENPEKVIDNNLELEESGGSNKYMQNDSSIVEMDSLSSENVKGSSKCDVSINETLDDMVGTQESSVEFPLNSSKDEEEDPLKTTETVDWKLVIEEDQKNTLQNKDGFKDISQETSTQNNNNNNNESNINDNEHETHLNCENSEWITHESEIIA